jgi:hypothetical protein
MCKAAKLASGQNHQTTSALHQKFIGPYTLGEPRGENVFNVPDLRNHPRIHRTRNVKQYIPGMTNQPPEPPPLVRILNPGAAEYEFERTVTWMYDKNDDDRLKPLIKWKGRPEARSTCAPPTNLTRYSSAETLR